MDLLLVVTEPCPGYIDKFTPFLVFVNQDVHTYKKTEASGGQNARGIMFPEASKTAARAIWEGNLLGRSGEDAGAGSAQGAEAVDRVRGLLAMMVIELAGAAGRVWMDTLEKGRRPGHVGISWLPVGHLKLTPTPFYCQVKQSEPF